MKAMFLAIGLIVVATASPGYAAKKPLNANAQMSSSRHENCVKRGMNGTYSGGSAHSNDRATAEAWCSSHGY